ncbi:MAG: glucokinase [Candidatus Tyloplasma litorale]|nr:MAG: glucokinase [Mycoplasmatales bacterium]
MSNREQSNEILLAADIGGTNIKLALINVQGLMLDRWEIKTNLSGTGSKIPEEITREFKARLQKEEFKDLNPIAMGIGIPGFAALDGTVKFSGNIGWRNYDIKSILNKWWDLPIAVHNDCDVAALGEKFIGAGKDLDDFVFITLGTGNGAGLFLNGELYMGSAGTAGEFGHIPIQVMNPQFQCTCGLPECAEPVFSATGLVNFFRKHRDANPDIETSVLEEDGFAIWEGVRAGDEIAIKAAEEFAEYGGRVCATVAMALNPAKILLGGGLAHHNPTLIEYLQPVYERFVHKFISDTTKLDLCIVGNDAGLYGAAYAGMKKANKKIFY